MNFIDIIGEEKRIYTFGSITGGLERFEVVGVVRICIRPSGMHRLETADGRKFIVAAGWMAIEVVAKEWSL